MADAIEIPPTEDVNEQEDSNEAGEPEVDQTETNELLAGDDVMMEEESCDDRDLVSGDEKQETDEAEAKVEQVQENETQEDEGGADEGADELTLTTNDFDLIDETGMDDEEEEGKENHEGDGEHEDIMKDDVEAMDEDDEEEEEDDTHAANQDPNVMPQVNVAVLAQRKWQVKVYPLKPSDFVSGHISRVFKHARESLLYLLSPGRNARGKGEMYISSVNQVVRCVHSLMRMEYYHPEINVEVIKKNDEGVVEEKGYLRFDSKLTQILTMRPSFRRGPGGRKRDRLIGSVFVKNLPPGTSKDMLRVLFPFAQEINYNPEKFKDCTARLVLHYRSHVIPCLKAFAKVELGGNTLELHPLTKRKRTRTEEETEGSEVKQRRKSEEPKKDAASKKTDEIKTDTKVAEEKKDAPKATSSKESTKEKPAVKSTPNKEKKDGKDKRPNKAPQNRGQRKPPPKTGNNNQKKAQNDDKKPYRPKLVGGKEKGSTAPQTGKFPRANRGRQDRAPASSPRFRDDRNREFRSASRRFGNNNVRSSRQSQGSMSRSSYGVNSSMGLGSSMAAADTNLAINAEATKEMVLLQNQLSMAIKNQLAMLNQTQLAVEHAKRGASSIGLGSDVQSLPSRGSQKGGGRRSIDQYRAAASLDDAVDRYTERPRNLSKMQRRSGGGGGYDKRGAGGGYRSELDEWEREVATSHLHDPYASSAAQDYAYDRVGGASARGHQSSAYGGGGYSDSYYY